MSDSYHFLCHFTEGLPQAWEERALEAFGSSFRVSAPCEWNFDADRVAYEPCDADSGGRLWRVTSVGLANFALSEVGCDVIAMSMCGSALQRLVREIDRDGYTLIGLINAVLGGGNKGRVLCLANLDLAASLRLVRGRGLPAQAIPHVVATWRDAEWAKILLAHGGVADPMVDDNSAFRWPDFPGAPFPSNTSDANKKLLLTRASLEQILHDGELHELLSDFTAIDDEAAEALAEACGEEECWVCLNGLTCLSETSAKSLSRLRGWLYLEGLSDLSDAAARRLAMYRGDLFVNLDLLPASAAAILAARTE